jgi:tetratricopeptide (TPR) repeat protein
MNRRSETKHNTPSLVFVSHADQVKRRVREKKKLSFSAIIAAGVFCAFLTLIAILAVRHIHIFYHPSVENTERLLTMGKPREAIALLNKLEKESDGDAVDSRASLLRGKALYAILLEKLRREKWGSYGLNPDNWLAEPLAAEAEQCFIDAMAAAPDDPEIRLVLGNLYREQGRFSDAELIFRTVLEIDDQNAEAYLAIGLLYAEGKHIDAAGKALAAAWELDPGNPKIAKNMAYFYRFYANDPEASIEWFSRYLQSNPKRDPDVNLIRAELADLIERYPEYDGYKVETDPNLNRGVGRKFTARKLNTEHRTNRADQTDQADQ